MKKFFSEELQNLKNKVNKKKCDVILETNDRQYNVVECDDDKISTSIVDIELGKQYRYRITVALDLRVTNVTVSSPFGESTLFSDNGYRLEEKLSTEQLNQYIEAIVDICKEDYIADINMISSLIDDIDEDINKLAIL